MITKASEVMELVNEYGKTISMIDRVAHTSQLEGLKSHKNFIENQIQDIADEFANLKYCYAPNKVLRITGKLE